MSNDECRHDPEDHFAAAGKMIQTRIVIQPQVEARIMRTPEAVTDEVAAE